MMNNYTKTTESFIFLSVVFVFCLGIFSFCSASDSFLDEFGQWLRHKVRVIIIKQWKRPKTVYRNLMKLNRICKCNMSDEDIFKVANSRLGLYRRCSMDVVNYLLSPKVLEKANKKEGRPALVNPLNYYLS